MNQVGSSKCFDRRKNKILSSRFKLPSRSPMAPVGFASAHHHFNNLHTLLRSPEVVDHLLHPPSSNPSKKLDLLLSVEKIEKETIHNILLSFSRSQLLEILEEAAIVHPNILHTVLSMIDDDPSRRKLFVRSLGPFTTSESLRRFFSRYGVVEEAKVVFDKATGNSKGYGSVTFANIEAFLLALRNPSKKIDGFVCFSSVCVESDSFPKKNCSGAGAGAGGGSRTPDSDDTLNRTIRVENVPPATSSETLVNFFGEYGEIQEGPGGFDMGTGRSTGFAYFVYKNEENAKAALAEPRKTLAGFDLFVNSQQSEFAQGGGGQCGSGGGIAAGPASSSSSG